MTLPDSLLGLLVAALGGGVLVTALGWPALPGQPIGPGTAPGVLGVLLMGGGALLAVSGIRSGDRPRVRVHPGWRRPERLAAGLLATGGVLGLAAAFETVGFPLGVGVLAVALLWLSGMRHPGWSALALMGVLGLHLLMTRLLSVPLPAGPLRGVM
ncbi:tripartite tricarboxylate transporter TctB family protein [Roseospira navarrensis]|uniref:DUF1468 domain-containing protein n=1 Tax=Roseospira navarrensis TaxID=140058 RepID=A0A7X2D374_9PROT|nr:tripartite tricarboxylate transporter TctB family protein [Roseospira navarrensis]MQX37044.1 hypothetical protein [Roseospira navarrensis]